MNFVCIQDCSRCPFFCHQDLSLSILNHIDRKPKVDLPKMLKDSSKIQSNFAENLQKNDEFVQNIEKLSENQEKTEEKESEVLNLPAIQEIQYTVETVKPRKIFDLFRRKNNG